MPCRSCKRSISAEDAAFGVCPHCGTLLDLIQSPPSSNYSFQPVMSASKKRSKATPKSKKLLLIAGGTVLTCVGLLTVAGIIFAKSLSKQPVALDNSNLGITSAPELTAEIEGKSAPASNEPTSPTPSASPEPASTASSGDEITELLRKQQIVLREDIIKRVEAALKLVRDKGIGHVVVGKLKMQGTASVRDVIAQMEILDDGYFVDAVATAGFPVYFWHPGYDRLEVIPKGPKLSIENLGEIVVQPNTKPAGTLKGLLLANVLATGGEVPKDVKGTVTYYLPFINVCKSNDAERQALETELHSRLQPLKTNKIDIVADTGEFQVSQLAELPFGARLDSGLSDSFEVPMPMDVFPGDELNLGQVAMRPSAIPKLVVQQGLSQLEWAPDGQPTVKKLLTQIKDKPQVTQYFQERVGALLKQVEAYRKVNGDRSAVVIVGQVVGPSSTELLQSKSQIAAHMRMGPDGYFCAAVAPGRPVGFSFCGYDPLEYIPRGTHDGVEYCGVQRMKKTSSDDFASVQGSLIFEAGKVPAQLRVQLHESPTGNSVVREFNMQGNASGGLRPRFRDNIFQFNQLSPLRYACSVDAKGYVGQERHFQLMPKDAKILRAPIFMFRSRNVKLSYFASTTGNFSNSNLRQAVVSTETSTFRGFDDPSAYATVTSGGFGANYLGYDFLLIQKGNTVFAKGARILDLGSRSIEECATIDVNGLVFRHRVNGTEDTERVMRPGRVYLAHCGMEQWTHWILFRPDSIEFVPINL